MHRLKNNGIILLSNLILAMLAAVLHTMASGLMMAENMATTAFLTGFIFFVGYSALRYKTFLQNNKTALFVSAVVVLLVFGCSGLREFNPVVFFVLLLLVVFYYLMRIKKQIINPTSFIFAWLKIMIVGIVWALATVALFSKEITSHHWPMMGMIAVQIVQFMLPIELRHQRRDHTFGISTVADFFTRSQFTFFSIVFNCIFVFLGYILTYGFSVTSFPVVICAILNAIAFYFFIKKHTPTIFIDCFLLAEFLLLYIAYSYLLYK